MVGDEDFFAHRKGFRGGSAKHIRGGRVDEHLETMSTTVRSAPNKLLNKLLNKLPIKLPNKRDGWGQSEQPLGRSGAEVGRAPCTHAVMGGHGRSHHLRI